MAWLSNEEQAMFFVRQHLEGSSYASRLDYYRLLREKIFPRRGWVWEHENWDSYRGVTAATVFGNNHLLKNLSLAILGEMLGLGPEKYCIIDSDIPDFESRLLLVLRYLPLQKICLYPPRTTLGGPFSQPPWRAIGETLCACPSPEENDIVGISYFGQVHEMEMEQSGHLINNRTLAL